MTQLWAKGSVVHSTLRYLGEQKGEATVGQVVALLAPATRDRIDRAGPTDELPYEMVHELWQAADRIVGPDDPEWMQRSGAFAIESTGVQLYSGILKKSSPSEFLRQSVSLFRLYYHPGNMEVVYEAPGSAVLRLLGFDPGSQLFCRRQTGGLREALTIAGGTRPNARHVRCALEGDAFCEWELTWSAA